MSGRELRISSEWFPPQLVQPAEDAQHQLLPLYTVENWRLGFVWLGLCVHDSFEEFPEEKWQSYPPRVIFLCSCNHFLSHEGRGEKKKKVTLPESKKNQKVKKQVEVQWITGGSVCVYRCVFLACVHMLISQIGDDDT